MILECLITLQLLLISLRKKKKGGLKSRNKQSWSKFWWQLYWRKLFQKKKKKRKGREVKGNILTFFEIWRSRGCQSSAWRSTTACIFMLFISQYLCLSVSHENWYLFSLKIEMKYMHFQSEFSSRERNTCKYFEERKYIFFNTS